MLGSAASISEQYATVGHAGIIPPSKLRLAMTRDYIHDLYSGVQRSDPDPDSKQIDPLTALSAYIFRTTPQQTFNQLTMCVSVLSLAVFSVAPATAMFTAEDYAKVLAACNCYCIGDPLRGLRYR